MSTIAQLSEVLPPIILGVGIFNHQYNKDPFHLPANEIIYKSLSYGIRAFDTSPYYGPSEEILGQALASPRVAKEFSRQDYFILTKVGRIAASEFDYSPSWIQYSVQRSLERLGTTYLDVVYCHDVEFVSKEEVVTAVKELRKIRNERGAVKSIGISGYPVDLLCELAELVLKETGEPLDLVMSYCNSTLQNTRLNTDVAQRLKNAGVKIVPNASPLSMGLLRTMGAPVGDMGDFHPAGPGLRKACRNAAELCKAEDEKLETIALRFAIDTWARNGSEVGTQGPLPVSTSKDKSATPIKLGVTVLGCSYLEELDQSVDIWRSIVPDLGDGRYSLAPMQREGEWSQERIEKVKKLTTVSREALSEWIDYAWDSPGKDYVNTRVRHGAPL